MRVSVWGPRRALRRARARGQRRARRETRPVVFDGERVAAAVLRGELAPGTRLAGPALCALPEATLLVPPGWSGEVDELRHASACIGDARAGERERCSTRSSCR